MKQLLIILIICFLYNTVEASEEKAYRIKCKRSEIIFPSSSFPLGMPFTNREVCDCSRKRWRGTECNIKFKNENLYQLINQKNNLIADEVLKNTRLS
tara:strand:+ start:1568 stop:1858 length:291 start_codon:yes stop_codon:yes gene_type:complete